MTSFESGMTVWPPPGYKVVSKIDASKIPEHANYLIHHFLEMHRDLTMV